ncbi:MAG: outer membrane beta-barrel protein [Pseudomonadota bacterium]
MHTAKLLPLLCLAPAAMADPYAALTNGVCEIDLNNVIFSKCDAYGVTLGADYAPLSGIELRYTNETANIDEINGARRAGGTYDRNSVSAYLVRAFDTGWAIEPDFAIGAGVSDISYRFEGPADGRKDFIVTGDGDNTASFWAVEAGVSLPVSDVATLRVSADYLQHGDQVFTSNVGGPDGFQGKPRTYSVSATFKVGF